MSSAFFDKIRSIVRDDNLISYASSIKGNVVIYDFNIVKFIINIFRESFPKTDIKFLLYYAAKANHNEGFISLLSNQIDGVDVASIHELDVCRQYYAPNTISLNGPSFSANCLQELMNTGLEYDFNTLGQINSLDIHDTNIGIRVKANKQSRFGINLFDESSTNHLKERRIKIKRIHLHYGENNLDKLSFISRLLEYMERTSDIFTSEVTLNLGGGFNKLLISDNLGGFFERLSHLLTHTIKKVKISTVIIEPGLALSLYSGFYFAEVLDVSITDNTQMIVIDTSKNKFFPWHNPVIITGKAGNKAYETKIYGNTCYEDDVFFFDGDLPKVTVGQRLMLFPAGAYVSSNFSNLHGIPMPKEVVYE